MISIIVPVYNGEKYLPACIESILQQSYTDFELILVDDCSTDHSYELCKKYAEKDTRIVVLKNKANSGTSKSRNAGLLIAKGEYIAFVDDDDILSKEYLKVMYDKLMQYDSDVVQCRFIKFKQEKDIVIPKKKKEDVIHTNISAIDSLYCEHGVQTCVVFNKLYKKSVFDTIRFDDYKVHEDVFIIHKIMYESEKIVFIDNILYYYRKSGTSITTKQFNKSRLDEMEGAEQRVLYLKKFDKTLYYKAMIQLGEAQVNMYYNMKVFFPKDKEEIYLIRKNFLRYFKLMKKRTDLMNKKTKSDIFGFRYIPHLYYWINYRKRLDFFTES